MQPNSNGISIDNVGNEVCKNRFAAFENIAYPMQQNWSLSGLISGLLLAQDWTYHVFPKFQIQLNLSV